MQNQTLGLGGFAEKGFIGSGKCRVILKPAVVADPGDGLVAIKQFSGAQQAFAGDVAADGVSGFLLELTHHMVFAEIECPCQAVDG